MTDLLSRPECRLVTLFGPGGVGKTRLAAEFLHRDAPKRLACFIPLESAHDLAAGIVEGLGIGVESAENRLDRIAAALGDAPTLLVLDNVEHLAGQAEALGDLLAACGALTIVTTSRVVLGLPFEWVLPVDGLSHTPTDGEPESMLLFAQRFEQTTGRPLSAGERLDAERICAHLQGVPLALELAATWSALLPVADIAADIEQRREVLSSRGRGLPARQQSLRAVFEHSWRLLTDQERIAFARLSVFRDGFERDAASAAAGVELLALGALMAKSLLQRNDDGRFRLHPLMLEFAREQLDVHDEGHRSLLDAHADYYLGYLAASLPDIGGHRQVEAAQRLTREWANIHAAWEHALRAGRYAEAARSLYIMDMVCSFRSRYDEAVKFAAEALATEVPPGADDGFLHFTALVVRAWVQVRLGNFAEAEQLSHAAEEALESRALPPGLHLDPLLALGTVELARGNYREAEELATRAVERARNTGHKGRESLALYTLENACWEQARYSEAAAILASAFQISESLGDSWFLAFLHNDFARQALRHGKLADAESHLARSVEIRRAFGDAGGQALAEEKLAGVELLRGAAEQAGARLLRALDLFRKVGDQGGIASAHAALGRVALMQGDRETARERFSQALGEAEAMGYEHLVADVLLDIAVLSHEAGDAGALDVLALLASDPATPATSVARIEDLVAQVPVRRWSEACVRAKSLSRQRAVEAVLAALRSPAGDGSAPVTEALTPRETDVLRLMASGATNAGIAEELDVKLGTAKWYTSQVISKLGARNRTDAVARARQRDLIP